MTNVAPIEYLLNCRVEAARRLLRTEPGRSISDIGFECGFQSSQYFTTVFRRRTGLSPREFRRLGGGAARRPGLESRAAQLRPAP